MSKPVKLPWDYSKEPGPDAVPNLPTPEGRALGKEMARLTKIGLEQMKREFPDAPSPCNECAFVEGTIPNGCHETIADALKCAVENEPFYCHKGIKDGQPKRLCAGWCAATDGFQIAERVRLVEEALGGI